MELRLKEIRTMRKLSQQEMADALGVKKPTYGTWERGERMLNAEQLLACANALGCSCDAILGREVCQDFADPMEKALHVTWNQLDANGKSYVMQSAEAALALSDSRRESASQERSSLAPPGEVA